MSAIDSSPASARRQRANATSATGNYFAWLDPLRGFAAISVVLAHLVMLAALPIPTWYPLAWFRIGFLGVDLFFAISGAVILFSLADLRATHGPAFRAAFAWRRLARILPLYLLTATVFVLVVQPDILNRQDFWRVLFAHLFFVHNLSPSTHGVINGPSWTLGVEMQFYLMAMLIGPWLLQARMRTLLLAGALVGLGWRTAVWWWARESGADGNQVFIYSTQLPGVIDQFVAGMLAVRWLMLRRVAGSMPGLRTALWLAVAALLAWAGSIALMHQHIADYWQHPATVIGLRSLLSVAVGLSVAAALSLPNPIRRLPGLRMSGDLSYGIYLWHMGVLLLLQRLWPDAMPWPFGVAVVAISLVVSWLAFRAVEKPLMRWARQRKSAGVST